MPSHDGMSYLVLPDKYPNDMRFRQAKNDALLMTLKAQEDLNDGKGQVAIRM